MRPLLVYLLLAVGLTWPAALHPVAAVPGGARTDLWDGLWSFWFVWERLSSGASPFRVDGLLNLPNGGAFWVADPVNAVLALPLVPLIGPAAAWTVLVIAHLTFSGRVAHALGEAVTPGSGWLVGVGVASAPMVLAQVQNGATEAVGQGWLVLALLRAWRLREAPGLRNAVLAGAAAGLAAVAHWYGGVAAVLGLVILGGRAWRPLVLALGLAAGVAAPFAWGARTLSTAPDNVVGIKSERELATVRRTIGAADPRGFLAVGDFRSPDFASLSRYDERYVHAHPLGWVAFLAAVAGLRRRTGMGPWWAALVVAVVLACGPVLVKDGGPLLLPGRRGVPLPYFLIERLPPFDALSLVYRLALLAVVAVHVLAGRGLAGTRLGRWAPFLFLAETRLLSQARTLPEHVDARVDPAIVALADAPAGGVMNYPLVAGRPYLYEQTAHRHPVAATLNFPNNGASKKVWSVVEREAGAPCEELRASVGKVARSQGIAWLVVHEDALAEPDPYGPGVQRLLACVGPPPGPVRIVRLHP